MHENVREQFWDYLKKLELSNRISIQLEQSQLTHFHFHYLTNDFFFKCPGGVTCSSSFYTFNYYNCFAFFLLLFYYYYLYFFYCFVCAAAAAAAAALFFLLFRIIIIATSTACRSFYFYYFTSAV